MKCDCRVIRVIGFPWVTEFLHISKQHFLGSPQGFYVFLCDWSGSIFVFPSGENILLSIFNSGSLSFEEAFNVWKSHNVFIVHICCFCLPRSFFPHFWLERFHFFYWLYCLWRSLGRKLFLNVLGSCHFTSGIWTYICPPPFPLGLSCLDGLDLTIGSRETDK